MSHKPIAAMSGASLLGGITAYTRYGSVPSITASFFIGGAMIFSSLRIRDGMDWGLQGAAASSAAMAVPVSLRAVRTRAPIPITLAILAWGSTGYYTTEIMENQATL